MNDTTGDPCVREVKFTLNQLVDMIKNCQVDAPQVFSEYGKSGQQNLFGCINLNVDRGLAIYQSWNGKLIKGAWAGEPIVFDLENHDYGARPTYAIINVKNPFNVRSLVSLHANCAVNTSTTSRHDGGSAIFYLGSNPEGYYSNILSYDSRNISVMELPRQSTIATVRVDDAGGVVISDTLNWSFIKGENINFYDVIEPHGTKKYYAYYWLVFQANTTLENHFHVYINAWAVIHRNVTTNSSYVE